MPLSQLDVLALDLEHSASLDYEIDLVVVVWRLPVRLGCDENVDPDLEPGRSMDDLVTAGAGCEPLFDVGDVERLCAPQRAGRIRGLAHRLSLLSVIEPGVSMTFSRPVCTLASTQCLRREINRDREALVRRRAEDRSSALGQERGEVAADDLARRPPERLASGRERVARGGQLGTRKDRCAPRQDQAS